MPKSPDAIARLRDAAQRVAREAATHDGGATSPPPARPRPAWTPPPAAAPPVWAASPAEPPAPARFTVGSDRWHDAVEDLREATL